MSASCMCVCATPKWSTITDWEVSEAASANTSPEIITGEGKQDVWESGYTIWQTPPF